MPRFAVSACWELERKYALGYRFWSTQAATCAARTRGGRLQLTIAAKALATAAILVCPALAHAEGNIIGFGPAFYWDDAERTDNIEPDTGGNEGSRDYVADGTLNLQLWYLRHSGKFLWGGGIAFYNSYSLRPDDREDNQDDEPVQYGNMFQLYAEGDLVAPVGGKLDLLLGARAGLITLFQNRDLQRELDDLSFRGVSVWPDAPRLGVFLGPHVGLLWPLSERIALRSDFGVQFSVLRLYNGSGDAGGSGEIEYSASLSTTRIQWLFGLQIGF